MHTLIPVCSKGHLFGRNKALTGEALCPQEHGQP